MSPSTRTKKGNSHFLQAGYTLAEVSIAIGIASLVAIALATTLMYGVRSIGALNNYIALDRDGRRALDLITTDIRECRSVTAATPSGSYTNISSVSLINKDYLPLKYEFDSTSNSLKRTLNGATTVLVTNCVGQFALFQPSLRTGSWNQYQNPASLRDCKVVMVKWTSTRMLLSTIKNSEDIVTAKILMRN